MKKLVLLAIIVLVTGVAAAADLGPAPAQDLIAPQIHTQVQPEIVIPIDPYPYCPISPPCTLDKQCDFYCGGTGWGECVQFCCYCNM